MVVFLFLENVDNYEIRFVVNDHHQREELTRCYGQYFITNTKFSDIFYILSSSIWFTSSLETPIGGFFHSFRRKVFHLGHGIPIKSIGLSEKKEETLKRFIIFLSELTLVILFQHHPSLILYGKDFLMFQKARLLEEVNLEMISFLLIIHITIISVIIKKIFCMLLLGVHIQKL